MYKDPAVRLLPEVTSTSSRLVKLKLDERFALYATIDIHQGQELLPPRDSRVMTHVVRARPPNERAMTGRAAATMVWSNASQEHCRGYGEEGGPEPAAQIDRRFTSVGNGR